MFCREVEEAGRDSEVAHGGSCFDSATRDQKNIVFWLISEKAASSSPDAYRGGISTHTYSSSIRMSCSEDILHD